MIFNVLLAIIGFIIGGVASIMPTISIFPSDLGSNISTVVAGAYGWSWLFPVGTVIAVIGVLIILVASEFTFYAAMYVLKLIRG